jgi:FkbM family methyltransferase
MTRLKSYSQFGEDIEILSLFPGKNRVYVEVGANDGVGGSNSLLLEENGWNGLLIEANPDLIPRIHKSRPNSIVVHSAIVSPSNKGTINFFQVKGEPNHLDGLSTTCYSDLFETKIVGYGGQITKIQVPATTLDDILFSHNISLGFDFLSIDVEGGELDVLQGFSINHFAPKLILIEDNSIGLDVSVRDYLNQHGYVRIHRTGVNDWYVARQDSSQFLKHQIILNLRLLKWRLKRWFQIIEI